MLNLEPAANLAQEDNISLTLLSCYLPFILAACGLSLSIKPGLVGPRPPDAKCCHSLPKNVPALTSPPLQCLSPALPSSSHLPPLFAPYSISNPGNGKRWRGSGGKQANKDEHSPIGCLRQLLKLAS